MAGISRCVLFSPLALHSEFSFGLTVLNYPPLYCVVLCLSYFRVSIHPSIHSDSGLLACRSCWLIKLNCDWWTLKWIAGGPVADPPRSSAHLPIKPHNGPVNSVWDNILVEKPPLHPPVLPGITMTSGCPVSLRDLCCLEMMQRPSWKGISLLWFLAWWPISLFMGGSTWWGIDERERWGRGRGRGRDTWDVFAVQQNSSQWGQTVSALLIASPCQTIFKRNLLMQCGPAYFCFYLFLFDSSLPLFFFSPFHFFLFSCARSVSWSSHTSLITSVCRGKISCSPIRGKLFKQHPCLMLFARKANDVCCSAAQYSY